MAGAGLAHGRSRSARPAGVDQDSRGQRSGGRSCRSEPSARRSRQRPDHAVDGWPDFVQPDQLRRPAEEHAAPFGVTTIRGQMTHVTARQEITNPAFRRQDGPRHGCRFYSNSGLGARLL